MKKLGATGILYREGRVLLGRRNRNDAAWAGYLGVPGGGVEEGESVSVATLREFREETGLDIEILDWCCIKESERFLLVFSRVGLVIPQQEAKPLDGFSEVVWLSWPEILAAEEEITPLAFAGLMEFKRFLDNYHPIRLNT